MSVVGNLWNHNPAPAGRFLSTRDRDVRYIQLMQVSGFRGQASGDGVPGCRLLSANDFPGNL